ncbi:LysR family transcriptional regulator [Paludibacterium yongneupense]|uniref:LysR family transcriptional regulator n=1 Tax=Paludibacterium yongneupense TaxID=400061 RepID=UPI0004259084|nr:LysR family transcriptional regulator [Paludibacterium yongneupense]
MEIYQLRTFVTVAQQGHLTQAAEQLHLSQPAVTAQIKALEEEIGMSLFERSAGGVSLTRAGQEMLPRAQQILESARELLHHARALKGQLSGPARIGITLSPDILRIGPWVAALCERYPMLELSLQHGATVEVLNLVRKKELDCGFFLGKNPYVNVDTVWLDDLPFVLAAPASWDLRSDAMTPRDLGRLPWVGVSQFSSLYRPTAELWRELNIAPRKSADCGLMSATLELVLAGVGLALVRESDAQSHAASGGLILVPGVRKLLGLHFVYSSEKVGDPVVEALLTELRGVWPLARSAPGAE